MSKIYTAADVPDDLMQQWLQHLRDFDIAHPGCHFQVFADVPDMPVGQVIEMLQVSPSLNVTGVYQQNDDDMGYLLGELNDGSCPDCHSTEGFEDGPRGGLSQNITCKSCGSRFNVAPRFPKNPVVKLFFAQRI